MHSNGSIFGSSFVQSFIGPKKSFVRSSFTYFRKTVRSFTVQKFPEIPFVRSFAGNRAYKNFKAISVNDCCELKSTFFTSTVVSHCEYRRETSEALEVSKTEFFEILTLLKLKGNSWLHTKVMPMLILYDVTRCYQCVTMNEGKES